MPLKTEKDGVFLSLVPSLVPEILIFRFSIMQIRQLVTPEVVQL